MKRLLIVLLIILMSCNNPDPSPNLPKDVYVGTQGVVLEMFSDKLPSELYAGEDFDMVVKLVNKGVYYTDARLQVNVDPLYLKLRSTGGSTQSSIVMLEGKSVYNRFDDFELVSIPLEVQEFAPLFEEQETSIHLTMCYDYNNILITDVCIDTDPYDITADKKDCDISNQISVPSGQGGPVGISKVTSRVILDNNYIRPEYKIYITNYGGGTILRYGAKDRACSGSGYNEGDLDTVELVDIKFSNYGIGNFNCVPKILELDPTKADGNVITCVLNGGLISRSYVPTYSTPLQVELKYGYKQTYSKDIKLKKLVNY